MDANKMREDFEVSMQGMTFSVDLSRGNHGCYTSLRTHELYCSWVASWQSSREAVVVKLPADDGMDGHLWAPDVVAAIEAQGLKVAP
ncbi:hypothetical protein [Pseudomonas sp.]|uniref:hypothetical protein n=1 Tax=Pseudomonas sp. TaxID=306 RepID=UPI0035A1910D